MKTATLIITGLIISSMTSLSFGQEKTKEIKKEIRKEVRMEDENSKKLLTIKTVENGNVTEEVYEGIAAEEQLKKMRSERKLEAKTKKETKEVRMTEVDGKKEMTVITKKNGKETKEVYVGEKAEEKLKELEQEK